MAQLFSYSLYRGAAMSQEQATEPTTGRRPLFRLSNWQIILILLIIVGGRLVIDFSQRIIEGQEKLQEQRELEAEVARLRQEQRELQNIRRYYSSQSFVEAWAHDEGKMVREGEVLIIPLYQQTRSTTIAAADTSNESSPEPRPSWEVWWSLFFDNPPPLITEQSG